MKSVFKVCLRGIIIGFRSMENQDQVYFMESEMTEVTREVLIFSSSEETSPEEPPLIFVEEEYEERDEQEEVEENEELEVVEHEGELFVKIDDFNYVDIESYQNPIHNNTMTLSSISNKESLYLYTKEEPTYMHLKIFNTVCKLSLIQIYA